MLFNREDAKAPRAPHSALAPTEAFVVSTPLLTWQTLWALLLNVQPLTYPHKIAKNQIFQLLHLIVF